MTQVGMVEVEELVREIARVFLSMSPQLLKLNLWTGKKTPFSSPACASGCGQGDRQTGPDCPLGAHHSRGGQHETSSPLHARYPRKRTKRYRLAGGLNLTLSDFKGRISRKDRA